MILKNQVEFKRWGKNRIGQGEVQTDHYLSTVPMSFAIHDKCKGKARYAFVWSYKYENDRDSQ